MLKRLLLVSFLVSQGAFAHTVLMKKHVTSGNVPTGSSFVKNCTIYKEGFARISKQMSGGPFRTHTHSITHSRVIQIQKALKIAQNGQILTVGATCDGGDNLLYGYYLGTKFILDENKDCGSHMVNQSSRTPDLKTWALQACGF